MVAVSPAAEPPRRTEIVEVGPRDGLQNESTVLDTEAKLSFVARAVAAGARRIEVASFVNPNRVPQMADAEAVVAGLPPPSTTSTYIGLVLNRQGMERAVASGVRRSMRWWSPPMASARETRARPSRSRSTASPRWPAWPHDAGVTVSATVSVAFGCPFEGEVPVERVVEVAERAAAAGADEIALGRHDRGGLARPTSTAASMRCAT